MQAEDRALVFQTGLALILVRHPAVVTNDIFTKEDQEFLIRNEALADSGRIRAIETGACNSRSLQAFLFNSLYVVVVSVTIGGCPHAAIRSVAAQAGMISFLTREIISQGGYFGEHGRARATSG